MNGLCFVVIIYVYIRCIRLSELTIHTKSTELNRTVGQTVRLNWNITIGIGTKTVTAVEVYIHVGGKRTVIGGSGGVTIEGKKCFGTNRISRLWNPNAPYFFELTIKNISYSDEYIFHLEVIYRKDDGNFETDNSSSINLKVKGSVDICGDEPQETIEFGEKIKETLYLCGNPKPNVSITINGKSNFLNGDIEDERTKKYKYEVEIPTKPEYKPEYCGQSIDYKLSGYGGIISYKTKVIPKPVNDLTYIINATNCSIVKWEPVYYGKCSFEVKYQLNFLTDAGDGFQQETKLNQTTFVDCLNESIRNASSVKVRAVYKEKFIGKYSKKKKREGISDGISTTIKPGIDPTSPSSNKLLIPLVILPVILLVIFAMVFCFYVYKRNLFTRAPRIKKEQTKEEKRKLKANASENQKPFSLFFSKKTKKVIINVPSDDVQPDVQYEPTCSNKQPPYYSPVEPIEQYNPNAQKNDPYVKHPMDDTNIPGQAENNYADPNYSEIRIKQPENINDYQSNYDVVADPSHKTDVPEYPADDKLYSNLDKKQPNEYASNYDVVADPSHKTDVPEYPANDKLSIHSNLNKMQPNEYVSNYDVVADLPQKDMPEYSVVDKSKKQKKQQHNYDELDSYSKHNSDSRPLLGSDPLNNKTDYEEITSISLGHSNGQEKMSRGDPHTASRNEYDEIDRYTNVSHK